MSKGFLFWLLMILWLVLSLWFYWPVGGGAYYVLGLPVLMFVLLALLGWQVFGAPVK